MIFINHKIFDFFHLNDLYDYIIIKLSGTKADIWDFLENIRDIVPSCVSNVKYECGVTDHLITISYINSKYNFDYLNSLVNIIATDYPGVNFDISYPISGYDKCTNFISCFVILLVFFALKIYYICYNKYLDNSYSIIINVLGILISTILSVFTMIYFEKITQVISLAVYHDEQKIKLMRNIVINVIIVIFFNAADWILQKVLLYFLRDNKNNKSNCLCSCKENKDKNNP